MKTIDKYKDGEYKIGSYKCYNKPYENFRQRIPRCCFCDDTGIYDGVDCLFCKWG